MAHITYRAILPAPRPDGGLALGRWAPQRKFTPVFHFGFVAVLIISVLCATRSAAAESRALSIAAPDAEEAGIIASVNGEPIVRDEFKLFMDLRRANVFTYFQQTHKATYQPEFWDSSYGGEVPIRMLREDVLNELVRIKVQQLWARELGLAKDVSYAQFLKALAAENERRRIALRNREPIYGPQQYDIRGYYDYLFSNLVVALRDRMAHAGPAPAHEQLRERYERLKEKRFRTEGTATVKKLVVSEDRKHSADSSSSVVSARDRLALVKAALARGDSFAQAAEEAGLAPIERVFSQETRRDDQIACPRLRKTAMAMNVGEVSDIIEEEDPLCLIQCVSKTPGGYMAFEEVKDTVTAEFWREKYESVIAQRISDAHLIVNQSAYHSIK